MQLETHSSTQCARESAAVCRSTLNTHNRIAVSSFLTRHICLSLPGQYDRGKQRKAKGSSVAKCQFPYKFRLGLAWDWTQDLNVAVAYSALSSTASQAQSWILLKILTVIGRRWWSRLKLNAGDWHIFTMVAVVHAPVVVSAVGNGRLWASALDIIQPDSAAAWAVSVVQHDTVASITHNIILIHMCRYVWKRMSKLRMFVLCLILNSFWVGFVLFTRAMLIVFRYFVFFFSYLAVNGLVVSTSASDWPLRLVARMTVFF